MPILHDRPTPDLAALNARARAAHARYTQRTGGIDAPAVHLAAASAPALQVLRLLDPPAADPREHPEELTALALARIDAAIDAEDRWAESPDEAASTRFYLTGDASILDWDCFGSSDLGTMGVSA
jgi:hypothetical protein